MTKYSSPSNFPSTLVYSLSSHQKRSLLYSLAQERRMLRQPCPQASAKRLGSERLNLHTYTSFGKLSCNRMVDFPIFTTQMNKNTASLFRRGAPCWFFGRSAYAMLVLENRSSFDHLMVAVSHMLLLLWWAWYKERGKPFSPQELFHPTT
ncbi:hypothetical protein P692DRAFT_20833769 [Suillus brevipes Sb2]|nr:hypothetical protein P692DRAFT_20833769 [Suillus brevipes Sb2]